MIEKTDGKEKISKQKKLIRDAIINLLSLRIYLFGFGAFGILGNLLTYVLSYLRGLQGEHKTITLQDSYIFSIVSIVFGVVQIIAPAIQNKLGLRYSVIVGTFVILFAILLIYFSRLFILDILGYFILALGCYCLPLLDRNFLYYFYEIRGKLIGALSLVSALESAGLNMFAEKFIVNPQSDEADVDELYYPFNISENIRKYIIFVIIIFSICAVISIIFIIPFDKNIHGKGLFHTALKGKDNSEEEENKCSYIFVFNTLSNIDRSRDIILFHFT
jgi:MFS family permease